MGAHPDGRSIRGAMALSEPVPDKIKAKWAEIHAELQRRLEGLYERKAPAFRLAPVIHGEGGIPRRVEWGEIDRSQSKSA